MIRFAESAERDLRNIDTWITNDNGPIVATRVIEAVLSTVRHLDQFPHLGYTGRRVGTRELGVPGLPYVVVDKRIGNDIMVARIMHGAQQRSSKA